VIVQFGRPPNRIDLLNHIDGVSFAEAWASRVTVPFRTVATTGQGDEFLPSATRCDQPSPPAVAETGTTNHTNETRRSASGIVLFVSFVVGLDCR
jgi:hypothetical protein